MKTFFVLIPNLASALSGTSIFRYLYNILKLYCLTISTKFFHLKLSLSFDFIYNSLRFNLVLKNYSDLSVLKEIFVDKEYEWFPIKNPKIIIDLGAHFGDTALYYHACFPEATIIAVEPSPESYIRLCGHVKGVKNIIPLQAAIGGYDGEITLNIMQSSLGHSIMSRPGSTKAVVVQQMCFPTLFQKFNIEKADYIKFDIEGAEFDLFEDIKTKQYSKAYIGEVHEDLTGKSVESFRKYFINDFQLEIDPLPKKGRFTFRAK